MKNNQIVKYLFFTLFAFYACSDDKKEDPGLEINISERCLYLDSENSRDTTSVIHYNESFKVFKQKTTRIRNQDVPLTQNHINVTVEGNLICVERKFFEEIIFITELLIVDKKGKNKILYITTPGLLGWSDTPPDEIERNLIADHNLWDWDNPITDSKSPK